MPRVYEKSEAKKRRRGEKNQCAYAMWPRKKKRKDGESRRSRKNTRTRVGALDGFVEAEGAALVGWAILRGPAPLALAARAQASRTTRASASRARPPRLPLFFFNGAAARFGVRTPGGQQGVAPHSARAADSPPARGAGTPAMATAVLRTLGGIFKESGQALERLGSAMQGKYAFQEQRTCASAAIGCKRGGGARGAGVKVALVGIAGCGDRCCRATSTCAPPPPLTAGHARRKFSLTLKTHASLHALGPEVDGTARARARCCRDRLER